MPGRVSTPGFALALLALTAPAPPALAQEGTGSTGATVLQLPAGSRAAAFSGAYVAAAGDADVLFYNPAGTAGLDGAVSLAYERHVADMAYGSAAAALRAGPVVLGLAAAYFDAGEISVLEPDPDFGGRRGRETGQVATARESSVRLTAALPVGRLRLGAAAGYASSDLAGVTRSAPVLDLGAQYELPLVTIGAAIRNIGGRMSGDDADPDPLPTEARLGATFDVTGPGGFGVLVGADLAADLHAGTTLLATGVEAGLLPRAGRRLGAVARLGLDTERQDDGGLGSLRLGAGVSLDRLAVDYTYHELSYFGAVHRIGMRWTRAPR